MEEMINRAMSMMAVLDEVEVARVLMSEGVDAGTAFLAVKGAVVLLNEPFATGEYDSRHEEGHEPPAGTWASVAFAMKRAFPDEDFDYDTWKDEMKEADLCR